MDDAAILDLYWRREAAAIDETSAKYGRYCRRIALNILQSPEDAEESVNDTWLHAWNAIPPERPAVFSTWLARVTRNLSLSRLRERTAAKRGGGELELALDELSDCVPAVSSVEGEVEARELEQAVKRFLRLLDKTQRDVFLARYWFLSPIREISEKTGFSQSKIKSMLLRTRRRLQKYLREEGLL